MFGDVLASVFHTKIIYLRTAFGYLRFQENEQESDVRDAKSMSGRSLMSSVWLKEDDEEEMTDLLDRETMLKKIATARPQSSKRKRYMKMKYNHSHLII